jgi:membrane-bound lytic murein transglycosylase A
MVIIHGPIRPSVPRLLAASLTLLLPALPAAGQGLSPAPRPVPSLAQLDLLPAGLAQAVDHSLAFLGRPAAARFYQQREGDDFTLERVRRTLRRLRELLAGDPAPGGLQAALRREFEFHPVAGAVQFTGYFEPLFEASRTPTETFRYPLYRRPEGFQAWPRPHPTRVELVGKDGLQGGKGPLKGLELVWLKDRFEAFQVEVQGSARLLLADGESMGVGNSGVTDHPYVSIARLLAADEKLKPGSLGMPAIAAFFKDHPGTLDEYLSRCDRMAFFRDTGRTQAGGSLEIPITAQCSVATDKDIFPAGAPALIELDLPVPRPGGGFSARRVQRLVLDQDAGGAIKGPGRFDYFLGSGPEAGQVAGVLNTRGRAWYLLLKEDEPEDPDDE